MIRLLLVSLGLIFFFVQGVNGQQKRTCATMSHLETLEKHQPGTKARLARLNQAIQRNNSNQVNLKVSAAPIITIPVVVHVIYKTAVQNISQAQIQSQIDVLNEDFSRLNPDSMNTPAPFRPLAKDTQIRFALAKRDDNGDPTTGITRTATTINAFSDDDAMKYTSRGGRDAWSRDKYLNLWVCNMGGGILGYAQFPGAGPAASDGVVIGYNYFGRTGTVSSPFNKGRTATHEVGHWLGLYHIWGDEPACVDDDLVSDTPLQKGENYDCPVFPLTTTSGGSCTAASPGAMFMNYMDYVDDNCMNMFTIGQRTRMHSALDVERDTLFDSDGAQPVVVLNLDAAIFRIKAPKGTSCDTQINPKVVLKNRGSSVLTAATIVYSLDSGPLQTYQWTGNLASFATAEISLPAMNVGAGAHSFMARTQNPNGQADNDPANDAQTVTFTTLVQTPGTNLPLLENFESGLFPPAGWVLKNPDNATTWERNTNVAKSGNNSAFINNYNYEFVGEVDELILPAVNLASVTSPVLTFEVAYAHFSGNATYDSLQVLASTDCGVTFTSLYKKSGTTLATRSSTSSPFVPTSSQWRQETVSLNSFAASSSVIIKFRHATGYSNNLYLDDVSVSGLLSTSPEEAAAVFSVYPNPASGLIRLSLRSDKKEAVFITVSNAMGQEIYNKSVPAGASGTEINIKDKAAGIYLVKVTAGRKNYTQKLIITP